MPGQHPEKNGPCGAAIATFMGFPPGADQVVSDARFSRSELRKTGRALEMSDPEIRHLKPSVSGNLLKQFTDIGFRI